MVLDFPAEVSVIGFMSDLDDIRTLAVQILQHLEDAHISTVLIQDPSSTEAEISEGLDGLRGHLQQAERLLVRADQSLLEHKANEREAL